MYSFDTGNNSILGVIREYKGQTLLGMFNFSDQWLKTVIRNDDWKDISYNDSHFIEGDKEETDYWLEPYGFRWLLKDERSE